jgi:hypothetical protein
MIRPLNRSVFVAKRRSQRLTLAGFRLSVLAMSIDLHRNPADQIAIDIDAKLVPFCPDFN